MKPLILLTGLPGSGKTSVAMLLKEYRGLELINVGDVLLRRLEREGFACSSRADIGPTFLNHHTSEEIFETLQRAMVSPEGKVVDGIRLERTCQQFKEWHRNAEIWFIKCNEDQRLQRILAKVSLGPLGDHSQKEALDLYSVFDKDTSKISALADVILSADGDLKDLRAMVDSVYVQPFDTDG